MQAVVHGHLLDDEPEGDDVVGGGDRVGVAEVDLVLARRDLVVRRLDLEPHRLEHLDDVAPRVLAEVDRREVEVAADVVGLVVGAAVRRRAGRGRTRPPGPAIIVQPCSAACATTRLSARRGQPSNGVSSGL